VVVAAHHGMACWLRGTDFVTSGGPGVYGRLQFSTHMLQHMSLMIMVPFLFVLGAPVTLAMRTLPARTDGVPVHARCC
jgi:cytochrome c oxidase assembly factor CtaG